MPERVAGELQHFALHDVLQAVDTADAVGHGNDRALGATSLVACRFEILLLISSLISLGFNRMEISWFFSATAIAASLPRTEASSVWSPTVTTIPPIRGLIDLDRQIELALEVLFQLRGDIANLRIGHRKGGENLAIAGTFFSALHGLVETGNLGRTVSRSFWANSFSRVGQTVISLAACGREELDELLLAHIRVVDDSGHLGVAGKCRQRFETIRPLRQRAFSRASENTASAYGRAMVTVSAICVTDLA